MNDFSPQFWASWAHNGSRGLPGVFIFPTVGVRRFPASLAALALLLGGCGSDTETNSPPPPPPDAPFGLTVREPNDTCQLDGTPGDGFFPETLSETGCFSDIPNREPAAGVIPLNIIAPLWTDGELKERYIALPNGRTMVYYDDQLWSLPDGTILIKNFLIPAVSGDPTTLFAMETRFLVRRSNNDWEAYSYQWNGAGTDATLLPNSASTFTYDITVAGSPDTHEHFFPSRTQCFACHTGAEKARTQQTLQMNRNFNYNGVTDNQLRAMDNINLFGATFAREPIDTLPALPSPADTTQPLENRVRAYLHANCAHCHPATQPVLDLDYDTPLADTGLCGTSIRSLPMHPSGSPIIEPGEHEESVLYQRVTRRDNLQMPPIGTLLEDPLAEQILRQWIDGLSSCP